MATTGLKKRRKRVRPEYSDFGFTKAELVACTRYRESEVDLMRGAGCPLAGHSIPVTPLCPVAGLVGLCPECLACMWGEDRKPRFQYVPYPGGFNGEEYWLSSSLGEAGLVHATNTWTPPAMFQPVRGVQIYLPRRGACDDDRLAAVVRKTWGAIPVAARRAMNSHWQLPEEDTPGFCKGGLWIEALARWPGRGNRCMGQCWNDGHAIRLHSPTVNAMPDDVLAVLIAHELAHAYPSAARRELPRGLSVEENAVAIIEGWGFRDRDITDWLGHRQEELDRREEKRWAARREKWRKDFVKRKNEESEELEVESG
jgi:hypothetical protein